MTTTLHELPAQSKHGGKAAVRMRKGAWCAATYPFTTQRAFALGIGVFTPANFKLRRGA